MTILIILILTIFIALWLWITSLGVLAARYDPTLERFQRYAQIAIVIFIPILGAAIVLHLTHLNSPGVIPTEWIPWPFKSLILGNPKPANNDRDENEGALYTYGSDHSCDIDTHTGGHDQI